MYRVRVQPGLDPREMRASDKDRDRVADILREAFAEGRLTPEEHAERLDAVYRAKTLGELEPLVRDLPVAPGVAPQVVAPTAARPQHTPATQPPPPLVAIFSNSKVEGRWRLPDAVNAVSVFSEMKIDLRQCEFATPEVDLTANAIFGALELRLPRGVVVRSYGVPLFGEYKVEQDAAEESGAVVVNVRGVALFGSVKIVR
ncbi:DUF1707 domain-containing protein [Carbonactinospora thermoautotrophica]|uniref:DUF1707 SHOCT-like domain-containing protein n=1 Tax=Carbonactinospora thermoautotrophica TaxID=1469144 RepID=UPI00082EC1CB|nr:DUF1707 domain-containing protein [Carbonactinospora thermoautotrophica]MCX9191554.1 DUF1707 domain-containing protein [Carbonactinospora thermoautotrophica]